MTPNWLPQQNWMNVTPPAKPGKSTGQGIVEGATAIGSALLNRGSDEPVAPTPVLTTAPAVVPEPPVPVAPLPAYGVPPATGATDSPMLKKRPDILASLGLQTYGGNMA